jgi:hypothetical protein
MVGTSGRPRQFGNRKWAAKADTLKEAALLSLENPALGRFSRRAGTGRAPADDNINEAPNSDTGDRIFKLGEVLEQLYALRSGNHLCRRARATDQPKLSHVGMALIESLLISEGVDARS